MSARPADRAEQLAAWYRHRTDGPAAVRVLEAAGQGYSNEVLFCAVDHGDPATAEEVVVRLPPSGPPLFPDYDLHLQVVVQDLAHAAGVPVPRPLVHETDPSWLGAPFLVMPKVAGRIPSEVPTTCEWIVALPPERQRLLQTGFLDALAALHRAPWAGTPAEAALRDARRLDDDVRWWRDFAVWACEGHDPSALVELFDWCEAHRPATSPSPSVCWGDVRLGNVVVGDDERPAAVLDWEMATLGAPEGDLAWYTALSGMIERFFGESLPGFLDRAGIVAHYEAALGRPVEHLAWHERFAMARSAAAGHRTQVVAALAEGAPVPDPAANPVVGYTRRRMERFDPDA